MRINKNIENSTTEQQTTKSGKVKWSLVNRPKEQRNSFLPISLTVKALVITLNNICKSQFVFFLDNL